MSAFTIKLCKLFSMNVPELVCGLQVKSNAIAIPLCDRKSDQSLLCPYMVELTITMASPEVLDSGKFKEFPIPPVGGTGESL
jgi:hypothetical protein